MLKIAYVSFEYPPETGFGGIATYVYQASNLLAQRGNTVEVFSASMKEDSSVFKNGIWVHRVKCDRETFNQKVVTIFSKRHKEIGFNLLESPEYGADGLYLARQFSDLCFIVKTHTPTFLINKINPLPKPDFISQVRICIGALKRLKSPWTDINQYNKETDPEYLMACLADAITSPSKSLRNIIAAEWGLDKEVILLQPYPYIPVAELSSIPIEVVTSKIVTFVGRLEIRKGIPVLAKAIPAILEKDPEIIFHFVGAPMPSPDKRYNMKEYLCIILAKHKDSMVFHGNLDLKEIANVLQKTALCIFPSIWENFPNVCLEVMSAGRAIIGTSSGGMAEMLSDGAGLTIPPNDSNAIKNAVLQLIGNSKMREELGMNARKKIITIYNGKNIGELMETQYKDIINLHNG